eukprot:TRINITY_DN3222_c0_g1_i6.p1 TRINITY_DN3222_c0_g1~~TRINITY_DN3222_c0_g1_i6.p1  ORF type:complete len:1231 (-),score=153.55 TRINITY_DN3222_c0_g1_i6:436-4128(-)
MSATGKEKEESEDHTADKKALSSAEVDSASSMSRQEDGSVEERRESNEVLADPTEVSDKHSIKPEVAAATAQAPTHGKVESSGATQAISEEEGSNEASSQLHEGEETVRQKQTIAPKNGLEKFAAEPDQVPELASGMAAAQEARLSENQAVAHDPSLEREGKASLQSQQEGSDEDLHTHHEHQEHPSNVVDTRPHEHDFVTANAKTSASRKELGDSEVHAPEHAIAKKMETTVASHAEEESSSGSQSHEGDETVRHAHQIAAENGLEKLAAESDLVTKLATAIASAEERVPQSSSSKAEGAADAHLHEAYERPSDQDTRDMHDEESSSAILHAVESADDAVRHVTRLRKKPDEKSSEHKDKQTARTEAAEKTLLDHIKREEKNMEKRMDAAVQEAEHAESATKELVAQINPHTLASEGLQDNEALTSTETGTHKATKHILVASPPLNDSSASESAEAKPESPETSAIVHVVPSIPKSIVASTSDSVQRPKVVAINVVPVPPPKPPDAIVLAPVQVPAPIKPPSLPQEPVVEKPTAVNIHLTVDIDPHAAASPKQPSSNQQPPKVVVTRPGEIPIRIVKRQKVRSVPQSAGIQEHHQALIIGHTSINKAIASADEGRDEVKLPSDLPYSFVQTASVDTTSAKTVKAIHGTTVLNDADPQSSLETAQSTYDNAFLVQYGADGMKQNKEMLALRQNADAHVTESMAFCSCCVMVGGIFVIHIMLSECGGQLTRLYASKLISAILATLCGMLAGEIQLRFFDVALRDGLEYDGMKYYCFKSSLMLVLCLLYFMLSSAVAVHLRHRRLDSHAVINFTLSMSGFIVMMWIAETEQEVAKAFLSGSAQQENKSAQPPPQSMSTFFVLLLIYTVFPFVGYLVFHFPKRIAHSYRESWWDEIVQQARNRKRTSTWKKRVHRKVSFEAKLAEDGISSSSDELEEPDDRHDDMVSITGISKRVEIEAAALSVGFMLKQLFIFCVTRHIVPIACSHPITCYYPDEDLRLYALPVTLFVVALICMAVIRSQVDDLMGAKLGNAMVHAGMALMWILITWTEKLLDQFVWQRALPTSSLHSLVAKKFLLFAMSTPVYVVIVIATVILVECDVISSFQMEPIFACIGLFFSLPWRFSVEAAIQHIAAPLAENLVAQVGIEFGITSGFLVALLLVWRYIVIPVALNAHHYAVRPDAAFSMPVALRIHEIAESARASVNGEENGDTQGRERSPDGRFHWVSSGLSRRR